ncbi:MAG TPA: hypothetical protein VHZ04_00050 [Candidatus Paceibacterota bacterium]|jgi:hypothetical protein|nr:hypothetical protein [Candidatus Paceibacterota bacterium]
MSPPSQTPSSETTQPEELSKDSTSWKAYVTSLEMDDLVKKFKREYGRTKSENHPTPFGLAMNRAMSTTRERLTARKKKKGYEIVVTEIKRRVTMGRSISAVGRKNRPKDMGIVEPIPLPD